MIFIGIDPGLGGAVAALTENSDKAFLYDTPTTKVGTRHEYDLHAMVAILNTVHVFPGRAHCTVVLEHVGPMPGQGVTSMFSFGHGFGVWRGIVAGLGLRVELVRPQRWKKVMLDGRGKDKGASLQRARELFPSLSDELKRVKDHGRAEALLLAEYGRRVFGG